MKTRLLIVGLAALGLLGLTNCSSVGSGSTHYVPANNGKGGVQAVR